jgi:hypothetical protein
MILKNKLRLTCHTLLYELLAITRRLCSVPISVTETCNLRGEKLWWSASQGLQGCEQLDWMNEAAAYRRTNKKFKYATGIQVQVILLLAFSMNVMLTTTGFKQVQAFTGRDPQFAQL